MFPRIHAADQAIPGQQIQPLEALQAENGLVQLPLPGCPGFAEGTAVPVVRDRQRRAPAGVGAGEAVRIRRSAAGHGAGFLFGYRHESSSFLQG